MKILDKLKNVASEAIDSVGETVERGADAAKKAQETIDDAVDKGKQAVEDGKEYVEDKIEDGKEYIEEQKKAYEAAQAKKKAEEQAAAAEAAAKEKAAKEAAEARRQERKKKMAERKARLATEKERRQKERDFMAAWQDEGMPTMTSCKNACETCEKEGLPILLTRYAAFAEEVKAPKLSGPFGGGDHASISLSPKTHYGLRLLRSGYVYVYDENKALMDEYFVTEDSFLTKLAPRKSVVQKSKPATEFQCARNGSRLAAGVIAIKNPKQSGTIWIGYSDAQWTDDTYDKHVGDAGLRAKHMRKIQISGGKVAPQKHSAPIEQVGQHVSEYVCNPSRAKKRFKAWTPFEFHSRRWQTKDLIEKAYDMRPEGGAAVVALDDPAGIAAELDTLMLHYTDAFFEQDKHKREVVISDTIAAIERGIKANARFEKEEEAHNSADTTKGVSVILGRTRTMGPFVKKGVSADDIYKPVPQAELREAEEEAWKKYKKKIKHDELASWRENLQEEFKAYDQANIAPLAKAHADWMQSQSMRNCFHCNFDDTSIASGVAYAALFQQCIGATQDKGACFNLYLTWLEGTVSDKNNLLLRALLLNHEKTANDLITAANGGSPDLSANLADVVDQFEKATSQHLAGKATYVSGISSRVLGPITRCLADPLSGKIKNFLMICHLHTLRNVEGLIVKGSKKALKEHLIQRIQRMNPNLDINGKSARRLMNAEMRRMRAAGIDLTAVDKKTFFVFKEADYTPSTSKNISNKKVFQNSTEAIYSVEKFKALRLEEWREALKDPLKTAAKGTLPYLAGIITFALQYNGLKNMEAEEAKLLKGEETEFAYRLNATRGIVVGIAGELIGQAMEKAAPYVPKLAQGLAYRVADLLKSAGRTLGILGGIVMAGWDLANSYKEFTKGNAGLAALYLSSAAMSGILIGMVAFPVEMAGIATTLGITLSSTGIGAILVALIIVVSLGVHYLKDNKVQDWLEASIWGTDTEYTHLNDELNDLGTLFKAS